MLIFTKKAELKAHLAGLRKLGRTLGFVPTMGALHQGHISLINISRSRCDFTICSIFVNPTQFNDRKDLERYPRMPEKDTRMLENAFCDILFMPTEEEMYKGKEKRHFDFGNLDKILEGESRPGHFNGVAEIVHHFFEVIAPDQAFFGSKDYQQVMIVKELVRQMGSPIEIVSCPILREPDGLAMSSRNALLNKEERVLAANIPQLMEAAVTMALNDSISAARKYISDQLGRFPKMKLVYFEICDARTLQPMNEIQENRKGIALIAVFVGKIRLIDNMPLN